MNKLARFRWLTHALLIACGISSIGCNSGPQMTTSVPPSLVSGGENGESSRVTAMPSAALLASRLSDHHEWVKRLRARDGDKSITLPMGGQTIPIPMPPHVGERYMLTVNHAAGVAWLQEVGGSSPVSGPWKIDQPDVAHLLHSFSNPPTNSAPQATE